MIYRFFFHFFLFLLPVYASATSVEEILQRADEVRNPGDSYWMEVEIVDSQTGSSPHRFHVAIMGNDQTLVETKAPKREEGKNLLMLEENMWAYIPRLKRAVRVSLNQKLTGQAANGDISRMRWSGDYHPEIEEETEDSWLLFLTAKKKGLTYDKLRVWIRKASFQPYKAEFLSLSGKILKFVEYGNYRTLAGSTRPSEIHIRDALREEHYSVIYIRDMKVKKFPASLFHQRQLGSLRL